MSARSVGLVSRWVRYARTVSKKTPTIGAVDEMLKQGLLLQSVYDTHPPSGLLVFQSTRDQRIKPLPDRPLVFKRPIFEELK